MKVTTQKTLTYLSLFVFTLPILESQAEIFKCTRNDKSVYYNDKPCPVIDIEKKMNHIKDIDKGYVPESTLSKDDVEKSKKQSSEGNLETEDPNSDKPHQKSAVSQRDRSLSNTNSNYDPKKNSSTEKSLSKGLDDNQKNRMIPSQYATPPESTQTVKEADANQLRQIKTY